MGARLKTVICRLCGAEVEKSAPNRKYCTACARKVKRKTSCKYNEAVRSEKEPPKPKPKKQTVDVTQCRKCVFRGIIGSVIICDYAAIVGTVRGCEPSPNCVAFERYTKARRAELTSPRKAPQKTAVSEHDELAAYRGEQILASERYRQAHRRR